tara:strand:+ start:487 stop:684 length:198 start_codon:yes stop_codon:yes gene_type:complete
MKNFKEIKTTIMGLLFISSGLYYFFNNLDYNMLIFGSLEAAGVLLMLAPDKLIEIIQNRAKNSGK